MRSRDRRAGWTALAVALGSIAAAGVALADVSVLVCPSGKAPTDDGHCCWRGQSWSGERRACSGKPRCPPDMQPRGETCVRGCEAAAPAPATEANDAVGYLVVTSGAPARVIVDGTDTGRATPLGPRGPLVLAIGRHDVTLVAARQRQEHAVMIHPGQITRLSVELGETRPAPPGGDRGAARDTSIGARPAPITPRRSAASR